MAHWIGRMVAVALLAVSSSAIAQEICKALLANGVFNTYTRTTAISNYVEMHSLYCSDEASTYSNAKRLSASMTIPIGDILGSFGLADNESSYSQWRKSLCYGQEWQGDWRKWEGVSVSSASDVLAKQFVECVKGATGLINYATGVDSNSREFIWHFQFKPADGDSAQSVTATPVMTSNIACDSKQITVDKNGITSVKCQRLDCENAQITVNTVPRRTPSPDTVQLTAIRELKGPPRPAAYDVGLTRTMNERIAAKIANAGDECKIIVTSANNWCSHHFGKDECDQIHPCTQVQPAVDENGVANADYDNIYGDNTGQCSWTYTCQPPAPPAQLVAPASCPKPLTPQPPADKLVQPAAVRHGVR